MCVNLFKFDTSKVCIFFTLILGEADATNTFNMFVVRASVGRMDYDKQSQPRKAYDPGIVHRFLLLDLTLQSSQPSAAHCRCILEELVQDLRIGRIVVRRFDADLAGVAELWAEAFVFG